MNSTFMFGEDNFSEQENYSIYYHKIGGVLVKDQLNNLITKVYDYLDQRYPDEQYRYNFPSIKKAIDEVAPLAIRHNLSVKEIGKVIDTFAYHEIGNISKEYCNVLRRLHEKVQLACVIDIWAPKTRWLSLFKSLKINDLMTAISFSSDHGIVKPSPKPFQLVLEASGIEKEQALVVGDSVRRDLGGAQAAKMDCVLVGGALHSGALATYPNLIEFADDFLAE